MIGETVTHYRIVSKLGEGGIATEVQHHDTDRTAGASWRAYRSGSGQSPQNRISMAVTCGKGIATATGSEPYGVRQDRRIVGVESHRTTDASD
jgi:hypothetical protein